MRGNTRGTLHGVYRLRTSAPPDSNFIMADFSSWKLSEIKRDMVIANHECTQRGLMHSAKWCKFYISTL